MAKSTQPYIYTTAHVCGPDPEHLITHANLNADGSLHYVELSMVHDPARVDITASPAEAPALIARLREIADEWAHMLAEDAARTDTVTDTEPAGVS